MRSALEKERRACPLDDSAGDARGALNSFEARGVHLYDSNPRPLRRRVPDCGNKKNVMHVKQPRWGKVFTEVVVKIVIITVRAVAWQRCDDDASGVKWGHCGGVQRCEVIER